MYAPLKMATASDNTNYEELTLLEKSLRDSSEYMATEVKHEDALIFMGISKSGKSSLINYLIDNKLIGEKTLACLPAYLKKAVNDSIGPIIGLSSVSETRIPRRWESNKFLGWVIWDTPGFDDNAGPEQDIVNASYLSELFKHLKSVKIVLVIDINDIVCDRIISFLSLLQSIDDLFKGQLENLYSRVAIIFTKVPDRLYDNTVDKKLVKKIMSEYLYDSTLDIPLRIRNFVCHLIENDQNIGFFKAATVGKMNESSLDAGIVEAIANTKSLEGQILKDVSPSISDNSKIFLFKARQGLSLIQVFNELQQVVSDAFEAICADYENTNDRSDLHELLRNVISTEDDVKRVSNPEMSFSEKIGILKTLDPAIEKLVEEQNLLKKAKLMIFIDQLLGLEETMHLQFNLQAIIATIIAKCDQMIISLKLKLGELSKTEALVEVSMAEMNYQRELQKLKNELRDVKQRNESAIKSNGGNLIQKVGCVVRDVFEVLIFCKNLAADLKKFF